MKLCIAEKPSVAREIAEILGARTKKDGYFEGGGYCVTYTFGHLCTLKEPRDYDAKWQRWEINSLPILPDRFDVKMIGIANYKKQFKVIEKLVARADEIINCGDAGQEGELIQRWVLYLARCKKPIKRLWISSLTEEAIREGFQNLRDSSEFENLYQAGKSRAIGDWLLGLNATRLYTLKYGVGKQVLSVGRVQTPTLAMIVERQKEIDNFISKTFWDITTDYRETSFALQHDRIFEHETAAHIIKAIALKPLTIEDYSVKEGKEAPPSLFDLTSLQVHCNKQFGFSAEESLNLVQSLYEKKLVSYPRVDTTYLSEDIYAKCPNILKGLRNYAAFIEPLFSKKLPKSKKVFNDKKVTDHHAIIPTGQQGQMSEPEKKVYDNITRRFIGVFYDDCTVSNTVVNALVEQFSFRASGKQILSEGWRVLYPERTGNTQDEELMPVFEQGESGAHAPQLIEKQTQAPRYYSEGSLLRAMETAGKQVDDSELRDLMKENGIGRPSTRANIIETLYKREYIRKDKKRIEATPVGMALIDAIQDELLKSAELTGNWEKKLREIERGRYSSDTFLSEMRGMVEKLSEDLKGISRNPIRPVETQSTRPDPAPSCPKCKKGKVRKGKTAYGCNLYGKGCDFLLPFEFMGKKLTEKQLMSLVQKGKTGLIKGLEKEGKKTEGHLYLNENHQLIVAPKTADKLCCPLCKSESFIAGKTAFGCINYKQGCAFKMPFELVGNTLEDITLTPGLLKKIKTHYGG